MSFPKRKTKKHNSEQRKLALLKVQEEEFLQSIAELCGQPRKPNLPKEPPQRVGAGDDSLKLKIRLPSMAAGSAEERRKKRQRGALLRCDVVAGDVYFRSGCVSCVSRVE